MGLARLHRVRSGACNGLVLVREGAFHTPIVSVSRVKMSNLIYFQFRNQLSTATSSAFYARELGEVLWREQSCDPFLTIN